MTTVRDLKQSLQQILEVLGSLPEDEVVDTFEINESGSIMEMAPWGKPVALPARYTLLHRNGTMGGDQLTPAYSAVSEYDTIRSENDPPEDAVSMKGEISIVFVRRV